MKLALVFGKKQGEQVKSRLQGIKDNLDIDCFGDIAQFIDSAIKRNCIYDRIVILSTLVNQQTANDLYQYWGSVDKSTAIVVMCKKDKDENLARNFLNLFKTPVATTMLVDSTTVSIIAEAVLNPIAQLTDKYGISDYLNVEVDRDVIEQPKPVEQPVQQQAPGEQPQQSQPKEKRSLFGALFGSKKNKKSDNQAQQVQQVQPNQQINNGQQIQPNSQFDPQVQGGQQVQPNPQVQGSQQVQSGQQQMFNPQINMNNQQFNPQIQGNQSQAFMQNGQLNGTQVPPFKWVVQSTASQVQTVNTGIPPFVQSNNQYTDTFNFDNDSDGISDNQHSEFEMPVGQLNVPPLSVAVPNTDNDDFNMEVPNQSVDFGTQIQPVVDDSFSGTIESTEQMGHSGINAGSVDESSQHDINSVNFGNPNVKTTSTTNSFYQSAPRNPHLDMTIPSPVDALNGDDGFVENRIGVNDLAPNIAVVDEDFSAIPVSQSYESNKDLMTVDEDFGGENLADIESQYRQTTEQPKVVEKVVVKEVIRNVGGGSSKSALDGVYKGRLRKVVIVTGDRGTGVTSTAINIAKTLSKHVPVLYFDCDCDNHGLLNYIDYSEFKNYENIRMQGVKVCRTSKAFRNCVIKFEDNFDILSSDFDCVCSDEELQTTQEVVAERAGDYGVVVVDCPVSKLHLVPDLLLTGEAVVCAEGSKRGFMNMLCQLEASPLSQRHKRTIVSRGMLFVTKCTRDLDLKQLLGYIRSIYEPDDIDWLSMNTTPFNGKLDDKLLNEVLEG